MYNSEKSIKVAPILNNKVYIYALTCPFTGEVRYIGKANDIEKRYKSHYRDYKRRDTPVYRWIRKMLLSDMKVGVKLIQETDNINWKDEEKNAIIKYASPKLLNVAEGGDEPFCSKETRQKNGRDVAKSIHSDERKKKIWSLKQSFACELRSLRKTDPKKHNYYLSELHKRGLYLEQQLVRE